MFSLKIASSWDETDVRIHSCNFSVPFEGIKVIHISSMAIVCITYYFLGHY